MPSLMTLMSFIFISSCPAVCVVCLLCSLDLPLMTCIILEKFLRFLLLLSPPALLSLSSLDVFGQAQETFLCACHAAIAQWALSTLLLLCHNFILSSTPPPLAPYPAHLVKDRQKLGSKLSVARSVWADKQQKKKNFRHLTTLAIDTTLGDHASTLPYPP